jgi:hypothetical protein
MKILGERLTYGLEAAADVPVYVEAVGYCHDQPPSLCGPLFNDAGPPSAAGYLQKLFRGIK